MAEWGPWLGVPTPDGLISVSAKSDLTARLAVSLSGAMTSPVYFGPVAPDPTTGMVKFSPTGLSPSTQYHCQIEQDGELVGEVGKFRTAPPALTPTSFKFAFASCGGQNGTGYSNHVVHDYIRAQDPEFFIHTGDLNYADITVNDAATFRAAYDATFARARFAQFAREIPMAYMYSDHDAGPNDCDNTSTTGAAARQAYQECVPHGPLPLGTGNQPPYQEFSYGRTRFFMPDCRLPRDPTGPAETPSRTRLGATQLARLKSGLLAAREQLLFLLMESPWISSPRPDGDNWCCYSYERQEISQFLVDHNLHRRSVILTGDGHFLAFDDGRNNEYAWSHIPVLNSAPLDAGALTYSGPYQSGIIMNPAGYGQYTTVDITDTGSGPITWTARGMQVNPS